MRGALAGNEAFKNLLEAKSMPEPKRLAELRHQVRQLGDAVDKQQDATTDPERVRATRHLMTSAEQQNPTPLPVTSRVSPWTTPSNP